MQKSQEFSAKTVDEAVAAGLAQLGMVRDDVAVEIVERGKSGFLGIGAVKAVVRLSYEVPDEPKAPERPAKPAPADKAPAAKPAAKAAGEDKPQAKKPQQSRPQTKKPEQKKPVQQPKQPAAPAEPAADASAQAAPKAKRSPEEQTAAARAFLEGLLERMNVQAEIEIAPREGGGLNVNLTGEHIGAVIGRRGETLDAIQHLTNYVVNRGSDRRSHISVDAENYRAKREESLVHLAEKMAAKAIKYRRSMALEPMNSYERHVIHAALQDYPGVTTSSTGTEPNRRVVVAYVPTEAKRETPDYKEWF